MSLRENLLQELQKLRLSRERPFPIQAKKPKLTQSKRSQSDKLLEEAQKLLEGIKEEV